MLKKKMKVKTKVSSSESKTSTKSKFAKTNTTDVKKKKSEYESKGKRSALFKFKDGKNFLGVLPPVGNMGGVPYREFLQHNNIGPDGKGFCNCQRKTLEEPRYKCKVCIVVDKMWKTAKELKESDSPKSQKEGAALEEMAKKQSAKLRRVSQIIDVTELYDSKGNPTNEFPKCFGKKYESDEERDKHKCFMKDSCEKGVQLFNWPLNRGGPYEYMMAKVADDEVDITNFEDFRPVRIIKKGEKLATSYTTELANKLEIPDHVMKMLEEQATDLTNNEFFKPASDEKIEEILNANNEKPEDSGDKKSSDGAKKKLKSSKFDTAKPKVSEEQLNKVKERLKESAKKKAKKNEE